MEHPTTPQTQKGDFRTFVARVNTRFDLNIPLPGLQSPAAREKDNSLPVQVFKHINPLFFNKKVDKKSLLDNLEEWVRGNLVPAGSQLHQTNAYRRGSQRLASEEPPLRLALTGPQKDACMKQFLALMRDEEYFLANCRVVDMKKRLAANSFGDDKSLSPKIRRLDHNDDDEDESFHTAPNSPVKGFAVAQSPLKQMDFRSFGFGSSFSKELPASQEDVEFKKPSLLDKLNAASDEYKRNNMAHSVNTSFATTTASSLSVSRDNSMAQSFDTVMTEMSDPIDTQSTYADSVFGCINTEEMIRTVDEVATSMMVNADPAETEYSLQQEYVGELVSYGPFSADGSFSAKIPMRFRYELERIARAWGIPFKQILVGDRLTFNTQDDFWTWLNGLAQRYGRSMPEKSPRRAWEAATGDFKTQKHSEVAVLSGDMDWCEESESGVFKMRLNPLKLERSCRFHRRFGSDRFLTLTVPAPDWPPSHQKQPSYPSVLRESTAYWLARHYHHCLGRTWRAFYLEEVKTKRKARAEPRFRIEFFAVDGDDFDHRFKMPPAVAPPGQQSDVHTPMSVNALLEWHMPMSANGNQSNCKLFQRLSLGLSKTFSTVTLKPTQVLRLRDDPSRPVMNDGCALMSRALANQICDQLGITTATPSCFQGRIAGAKGLWMVDSHQSSITGLNNDDLWIQISDSQLKIHPHPQEWTDPVDDEKLTHEILNWSKSLSPVYLNIQILLILEHGGDVKEYIAKLTRDGVQGLYDDFLQVLHSNSPVVCRALLQKLKPSGEDGTGKARRMEQWMTNDGESIIRFSEAGFSPREFYPLRLNLRQYLTWLLERHVDELKIQVPLSTYAYCIADPYGVLGPDMYLQISNGAERYGKANFVISKTL